MSITVHQPTPIVQRGISSKEKKRNSVKKKNKKPKTTNADGVFKPSSAPFL